MPKLSNCIHYLLWQDVHYNDKKVSKKSNVELEKFLRGTRNIYIYIYIWLANHETLQGLPIYVVS